MTNEGWVCPTCRRVYAPFMTQCAHCPGGTATSTDNVTECDHLWVHALGDAYEACHHCGVRRLAYYAGTADWSTTRV